MMTTLFETFITFYFVIMNLPNEIENPYVTELKSLLKDKFFMLLLGISVAIVLLSTFYSIIRPKSNDGQLASGVQTSTFVPSTEVTKVQPTKSLENYEGIVGLEKTNTVSNEVKDANTKGIFDQIKEKTSAMFNTNSSKLGKSAPSVSPNLVVESTTTAESLVLGETAKTQVKPGQTYVVLANDNLWQIAEKVYGSGYNFVDIASANNLTDADYLQVGQQITLPGVEAKVPTAGDLPAQAAMTKSETSVPAQYTVVQGDSLWDIAVKTYNNGYEWTKIAQLNTLPNPDFINPGQILRLK